MVRKAQFEFDRTRRAGRKNGALYVVAAAGFFGLVLGTLLYVNGGPRPTAEPASDEVAVQADAPRTAPAQPQAAPVLAKTVHASAANVAPIAAVADVVEPVVPAAATAQQSPLAAQPDPAADRLARVGAHLEAGEFGHAIDLAREAADPAERSRLLKQIADVQLANGEFDAARVSLRRLPRTPGRAPGGQAPAAGDMLAGGGIVADFDSLIELIINETTGPWESLDGTGGPDPVPHEPGVRVDPHGMLAVLTKAEQTRRLHDLGLIARQADLNDDMSRPAELRLVSLTRLEREIARRLAAGQPVLETMRHVAGLSQIRYVFVYPEDGEVVIGGPAEGWRYDETGRPVGVNSGTPTLQLDDFVTVFRTFSPGGSAFFNCLIVPRQEGLRELKEYVERSNARGPLRSGSAGSWARALGEKLGPQDAQFNGIPTDSRVARVMLEADYRMKLIGIGRLDGGPEVPSYFDLLTPQAIQQNPPQLDALRWWLTMKYDAVLHSTDRNVFEIVGSSVLCQSENELVDAQGNRIHTGQADPTNLRFAANFSEHYRALARRDLAFADLQNIFDLALVAALLQHEQVPDRTHWDGGVFARRGAYQPARFAPPQTVETAVNHRVYGGKDVIVQVAGGVRGDMLSVLRNSKVYQEAVRLIHMSSRGRAPQLPEGRWWWDAAQN